jgi:hypothetical protein
MGEAVGQAARERGPLMSRGPSLRAESIVAILIPPACREEILGDLHERYQSPRQYALDAVRTIPLLIVSRVLRTSDLQVLLMQAAVLYMSFLSAAWLGGRELPSQFWELWRLAIPVATVLFVLMLHDAYAIPGVEFVPSALGPFLALLVAIGVQEILRTSGLHLALPRWLMLYGCSIGLLLSSAIRIWFPPFAGRLQGIRPSANPASRASSSPDAWQANTRGFFLIAAAAIVLIVVYQVWKRA